MDPFEPIFLNDPVCKKSGIISWTDIIDDDVTETDMTWSSFKIQTELTRVTRNNVTVVNVPSPGQFIHANTNAEAEWDYLPDIIHMMTPEEITALFISPDLTGIDLPSFTVSKGTLHIDGWNFSEEDRQKYHLPSFSTGNGTMYADGWNGE